MMASAGVEAVAIFQARDTDDGDHVDTFTCLVSFSGYSSDNNDLL